MLAERDAERARKKIRREQRKAAPKRRKMTEAQHDYLYGKKAWAPRMHDILDGLSLRYAMEAASI